MTDEPALTVPELLERLDETIQALAATRNDGPCVVTTSVIAWEQVTYLDDGLVGRRVEYAVPAGQFTISGAIGLLDLTAQRLHAIAAATYIDE